MKVIDEAKTPNGVKLELVDWSDELPMRPLRVAR